MPPVFCTDKKEDRTKAENQVCEKFDKTRYYKGEYIPKPIYDDLTFIKRLQEHKQLGLEEELRTAAKGHNSQETRQQELKLELEQQRSTETQIYKPPAETTEAETQVKKPTDWTLPGYDFLGPGTDLDQKRHHVPRSKLDQAAKIHDLEYENPNIDTRTADKKFIKSAIQSGELLGIPAAAAIEAKHHLGLNKYFRPQPPKKNLEQKYLPIIFLLQVITTLVYLYLRKMAAR